MNGLLGLSMVGEDPDGACQIKNKDGIMILGERVMLVERETK